jgi:hypothetical protein
MSTYALLHILDSFHYFVLNYIQHRIRLGSNHNESFLIRSLLQHTFKLLNHCIETNGVTLIQFGPTVIHKFALLHNIIHFHFNTLEWLATPTGIRHASAQCEELEELDLPKEVDIKPFDNLFKHDAHQETIHKDEITTFILEHDSRQIFQGPSTEIDHSLMQPGSLFGKLFLPNYPYVPHGVQQHLKFPGKLDEHTHLQQII